MRRLSAVSCTIQCLPISTPSPLSPALCACRPSIRPSPSTVQLLWDDVSAFHTLCSLVSPVVPPRYSGQLLPRGLRGRDDDHWTSRRSDGSSFVVDVRDDHVSLDRESLGVRLRLGYQELRLVSVRERLRWVFPEHRMAERRLRHECLVREGQSRSGHGDLEFQLFGQSSTLTPDIML